MLNYTDYIAFKSILYKEIYRFMRIWRQSLLPSAITVILYFLVFGHVLGNQIKMVEGFSYLQYIAPGLIMMTIITNAYTNVVSSFYICRFEKSVEELLVAPIPNYFILLGFSISGVIRGLIVGSIVTVVALCFTHLHIHNLLIVVMIALLTALLFALAGFTNALYARKFDDTMIVPTFILTPLTYLGGVFYSLSLLPPFWHSLSLLNPIVYMVNTFRYGFLGISDISIIIAFVLLIVTTVIIFIWNLHLLNKGVGIRT